MKKVKAFSFLIFVFLILLISHPSYANEQFLSSIDYNIKIHEEGYVSVSEIWAIHLEDTTNTLFKTFSKKPKNINIKNVAVSEINEDIDTNIFLKNSGTYNAQEQEGFFHATKNPKGEFEIAWGVVPNRYRLQKYKIDYTIYDCINVYNDCAEFYWQLIGNKWDIETNEIYGTITFPSEITNNEKYKFWIHDLENVLINQNNNNSYFFYVRKMPKKTPLELRLLFPTNIIKTSTNIIKKDKFDEIVEEEYKDATKEIRQEKINKVYERIALVLFIIFSIVFVIAEIIAIIKNIKFIKNLNYYTGKPYYKYFREIPNKSMDPVEASLLAFDNISDKNMLTSLIMSLAYKRAITIRPGDKTKDTEIILNNYEDSSYTAFLTDAEKTLIEYFKEVGNSFTINQFENHIDIDATYFNRLLNNIRYEANHNLKNTFYNFKDNNVLNSIKKINRHSMMSLVLMMLYIFLSTTIVMASQRYDWGLLFKFGFIIPFMLVILFYVISAIYITMKIKRINIYTKEGTEVRAQLRGLYNFLGDFSLIYERDVPEFELWEQYLVYATGFGIADKVLKKLKTRFPYVSSDGDTIIHNPWFYLANKSIIHNLVEQCIKKSKSRGYKSSDSEKDNWVENKK